MRSLFGTTFMLSSFKCSMLHTIKRLSEHERAPLFAGLLFSEGLSSAEYNRDRVEGPVELYNCQGSYVNSRTRTVQCL